MAAQQLYLLQGRNKLAANMINQRRANFLLVSENKRNMPRELSAQQLRV